MSRTAQIAGTRPSKDLAGDDTGPPDRKSGDPLDQRRPAQLTGAAAHHHADMAERHVDRGADALVLRCGAIAGERIDVGGAFGDGARDAAVEGLIEAAKEMGANGVIGIDFDYEVLGETNGMMMVAVSGTAVKLG